MSEPSDNPIRICHFSDLHLMPEQPVHPWKLLGKRALGYANLTLNRGRTHKKEHLVTLLEAVATEDADLVVVTGDFTSLALDFEFQNIGELFSANGLSRENTIVIPGNHDRYTVIADTFDAFEKGMAAWLPPAFGRRGGYPIVRNIGPVRLLALDTAVWRNPVRAAGSIDDTQLDTLTTLLTTDNDRHWPVIAMHHPPFDRGHASLRHYRTGLDGYQRFLDALKEIPATIIHGHMHVSSRRQIGGLDIIGVPSASNNTGELSTQLAYHVYSVDVTGLRSVQAVRLWPDRAKEGQIERYDLPRNVPAD